MYEKIGSIALILIAVVVLVSAGYVLGQRSSTNTNAVKIALADMTLHANALEHKQADVSKALTNMASEMRSVRNDAIDKILRKYGL